MVSKARLDLPDPETPVTTVMALWGISKLMFLRLCTRAPETAMEEGSSMSAVADGAMISGLSDLLFKGVQPGFWGQSKPKIIRRRE